MEPKENQELRKRLVSHIKGGQAFTSIKNVIDRMPFELIGEIPNNLPYSFYQQFYHIRFAQLDIMDYCRDENYKTQKWPDDYWPDNTAPSDESEWETLVQSYFSEREEFCNMILDSSNNLFEPFEVNPDHNLFREAELVIEHTAYHAGQLYVIYRLLNN